MINIKMSESLYFKEELSSNRFRVTEDFDRERHLIELDTREVALCNGRTDGALGINCHADITLPWSTYSYTKDEILHYVNLVVLKATGAFLDKGERG